MLRKAVSDEGGRVLVWALVVLGIGALTIPPLLAHISTNLSASRAIEERLKEQYAADSGVEYALLQLRNGITTSATPYTYTINNKYVEVTWGLLPITETYKITSTATSQIDGSSTTIESYITLNMFDYLWLLDQAITSVGDVELGPGSMVSGDVMYGDTLSCLGNKQDEQCQDPVAGPVTGLLENDPDIGDRWPAGEELSDFFWDDVDDLEPYGPGDVWIDLKDYPDGIGPLLYIGDETSGYNLHIENTGAQTTVKLEGTIYVIGDLDFEQPGASGAYTIDLNGQTIYVAEIENDDDHKSGDIYFAPQHVNITGSGCIIAEGFVNFQPGIQSAPSDFVFVMSVTDYVFMKPHDNFYGAIAGNAYVDLQPGCSLTWRDWSGMALNFPDGTTGRAQIHTYRIYPQDQ